eukprot:4823124-Prorocentrum_lima.AAC.1
MDMVSNARKARCPTSCHPPPAGSRLALSQARPQTPGRSAQPSGRHRCCIKACCAGLRKAAIG